MRDLLDRQLVLEWTTAQVVHDDPAKTLDTTGRTDVLLFPNLVQTIGRPQKTLDLVSPYFVPGPAGTAALEALAAATCFASLAANRIAIDAPLPAAEPPEITDRPAYRMRAGSR